MRTSKLWKIYKSLSTREVSQIGKFLRSPYFNKRSDVIDLFVGLGKMNLNSHLEVRDLHLFIWPHQPFSKQRLTYAMSFLVDLILQYFAHEGLKRDRIKKFVACSELLHDRRLDDVFNHTATKLTRDIDQMLESSSKYKLTYETLQIRKENFYRKELYSEISLNEINLSLDEYYLLEKLRIYIEAESLASRQADTFSDPIRASVLSIIQKNKKHLSPLIKLYLSVYEVLTSEGEILSLQQARNLLNSIETNISQLHLKELYLLTINYGIKQMNRGKEPFFKQTFQLYKAGLANGALLENGLLSSSTYKNITAIALRLQEYKWVFEYLHEYQNILHPKHRNQDFNYNLSIYHFATKNYEHFAKLANQLKSRNVHINCDIRRMYAIMFYEQSDWDVLEHHLGSFKAYLVRHRGKLSYHFRNWNQFIRTMTKLIRAENSKERLSALKSEIMDLDFLSSKDWFLTQLSIGN